MTAGEILRRRMPLCEKIAGQARNDGEEWEAAGGY